MNILKCLNFSRLPPYPAQIYKISYEIVFWTTTILSVCWLFFYLIYPEKAKKLIHKILPGWVDRWR